MLVVIVALEQELSRQALPADITVLHSGVGKINAALATAAALQRHAPRLVVNFGTAGGVSARARGLVEVGAVLQRDMMAMPLAPRGVTPFDATAAELGSGAPGLRCATGDSFVTRADAWLLEQRVDVVDMELYAIALGCQRAGVPWRSFKFITDGADGQAAGEWQARVRDGESLFVERLAALRAALA